MQQLLDNVLNQVNQQVLGKQQEIKLALTCLLAKGHLLIEDLPGMGKTTLAHALANALGMSFQRIQFTSDLLPSDVVGISIFDQQEQAFKLHPGPIFSQMLLADEINRASPKTQSALLEAMAEHQVSIDGTTYLLPEPFFVIATQNPLFHAGTYPLPESQLDRFTMRIRLGFPDPQAEKQMLLTSDVELAEQSPCLTLEQLAQMQQQVQQIYCADTLLDYVIALCQISREADFIGNPLSPRAAKGLVMSAKAFAFIEGRDHVIADDVKTVFESVCLHRMDTGMQHAQLQHQTLAEFVLQQVDPTDIQLS